MTLIFKIFKALAGRMAHSRRFFGERNDHLRPSVAESGVPGYDVSSWYALYVPGKTPPDIVEKLSPIVCAIHVMY